MTQSSFRNIICVRKCSKTLIGVTIVVVLFTFLSVINPGRHLQDLKLLGEDEETNEVYNQTEAEETTEIYNQTEADDIEDRINSNSSNKDLWKRRFPKAIIIGVQKAGTGVYAILTKHCITDALVS